MRTCRRVTGRSALGSTSPPASPHCGGPPLEGAEWIYTALHPEGGGEGECTDGIG